MKYTWCLGLVFILFSCGSNTEKNTGKDYEGMATDLCACMTPLSDLYEEVLGATAVQDSVKIQQLLTEFEKLSKDGEDCAAQLESKYGDFVGEEEDKAKAALRAKCPKIADMMDQE